MEIPREHIESRRKFVENLENIRYIHFRDLYPNIDSSNFQTCTKVDFKAIEDTYGNIRETWGRLKHGCKITYEFTSKTGSQYFLDDKDNVYRLSNHWGAVATCEWTREGKGQLAMSIFETGDWEIGVANLKDFQIFRRKDDRRKDIIVNPQWINQMKELIPISEELTAIKNSPEFRELPNEDKKFIGENFGYFRGIIKLIE